MLTERLAYTAALEVGSEACEAVKAALGMEQNKTYYSTTTYTTNTTKKSLSREFLSSDVFIKHSL